MKSNKYSWHLGNTDTNRNISSCPTAPGTLWALVSASSKLGPGTPSLRGTYLRVQPSLESPGPHLHPAWFLPGCSCGQQCPGPASQPPPSKAGGPGQMPPGQLPQQSYLQTPLAFELLPVFILASCPREKAAHACVSWKCEFQCLHFSAWLPLGSHVPHTVLAPLHVWTRRRPENLRVQRGRDTHREPRLPVAEGRDKWCPHTVRRKHCFIA